jgi:hypothetical protein
VRIVLVGHILFGTDAAFGTHDGRDGILRARLSVEDLHVPRKRIANIFSNNILNIIPIVDQRRPQRRRRVA